MVHDNPFLLANRSSYAHQSFAAQSPMLHIPDWYEFEREHVRREIEAGTYGFSTQAMVDSLPNAVGYIRLGTAQLTHGMDGFRLEGRVIYVEFS